MESSHTVTKCDCVRESRFNYFASALLQLDINILHLF